MTFHIKDDIPHHGMSTRTEQRVVVCFRHTSRWSSVSTDVGVLRERVPTRSYAYKYRWSFVTQSIDRCRHRGTSLPHTYFDEIARVRADVEKAIPRQSHDVVSVPASRRRVERDASSNASRRVRAARSYRERGLLFFVLDACGRVRRKGRSARGIRRSDACLLFRSRTPILSERRGSETRACGAREARGAEKNARPVAKRAAPLGARKTPPGSTSKPTRTRRRGDVANGRRARVVGIRESEGEASAEARLGERVVVPHEQVADGHFRSRRVEEMRVSLTQGSNERSRRRRSVPPVRAARAGVERSCAKSEKDPSHRFAIFLFFFWFQFERIR